MIFVTVGTHRALAFDRLLKPMDMLASELDEPMMMQCGCSSFEPRFAESFQFTNSEHMDQLMEAARVIVSHAAAGSAIAALRQRKPLVVVPRQRCFHEIIDDHQLQLAAALAAQSRAVAVYEPSVTTLRSAIDQAPLLTAKFHHQSELRHFLRRQLDAWQNKSSRGNIPQTQKV